MRRSTQYRLKNYRTRLMSDSLSNILDLLEAKSYVSVGLSAGENWSVLTPSFDGLKFNAIVKGEAWLKTADMQEGLLLQQGDCFILTRSVSFVMASDLDREPDLASAVFANVSQGVAKYGLSEEFLVIGGKMTIDESLARPLLQDLPTLVHIPADTPGSNSIAWLIDKLAGEIEHPLAGSTSIRSHLLHVLIVEGFRAFLTANQRIGSGWAAALRDPRIDRAMAALHSEPGKQWTLVQLANIAGMSRANFALRFKTLIGTSPMDYLSELRMQLASRALRRGGQAIGNIANVLGFSSESAFSARFKQYYGHSPRMHRKANSLL
ncbi:AraC family transcriptional regulator [Agrobacterium pusense]|nr:AraC family transcriptional regulator [Agrobacterium pusense]